MKVILSVLLLLASVCCIGQDSDQKVKIVTKDGTVLTGTILKSDTDKITLVTSYGEIAVKRDDVVSLDYPDVHIAGDEDDLDYMDRYSGSHYLFGQSAHGLKQGQLYYENTYLFLNTVTYGVTDNFSIGGGFEAISILFESNFPFTYLTPKLSFPFKYGAFSVGTTILFSPYDDFDAVGLLSGAVTLGGLRDNFTVGVGLGYTFEDVAEDFYPISISGMKRISDRVSLVTENVIATGDGYTEGFLSAGVRIHGRTSGNFLTLSLWRITEDMGDFLAFPFFSGTIKIR